MSTQSNAKLSKMEINHLLKDVINLNEYVAATQEVINKFRHVIVTLNIATVLTLKKIRSLEIEYLNKCEENGVACVIFERLLSVPPSKVWGVLAKELIYLLQYWLEAIRKHLVNHSPHWWMFLKLILGFIKEIRLKDPSIPNMLVELTAECLFDLATAPRPDVFQQHEILHCLNMVCAESSREIRFAMRNKFGEYFVKLASQMVRSGFLPAQYSVLECLLRWLVPRQERSLRAAAAQRWLPEALCPQTARELFLSSTWMNFFQDARDFLNALNEGNGLVKSVICRRLCVGEVVIINGTEKQQSWLDFNTSGRSVSVLLDPRVLEVFGVREHRACETLLVDDQITEIAMLRRESLGLTISLHTSRPPYLRPSDLRVGEGSVSIVVSSRTDLRGLDGAMRTTFGDKYQLLADIDTDMTQSPQRSYRNKNEFNSEEDTRFSHPVEVKRRKQSGYIVRTKHTGGAISPSTASTSSLIQLKDRLAALPRYKFDKEPVSVCAQPALSNVTELTEQDDRSIYTGTTVKFQPYGVCHKSFKTRIDQINESKSRSEGETAKKQSRGGRRLLSPVVSDDNSTSLLLVATVGSNESVINETIERLSKSKDYQDDNIVDLLVKEALQAKSKNKDVSDSGINTDKKKSQESESIDDTPQEKIEVRSKPIKDVKIVSKSTTDDESNTEIIHDTPFVNTRKVNIYKPVEAENSYNFKSVEEFFSQHIADNKRGEIVISPTLARKINETSSETSENFDDQYLLMNDDVHTDVEQAIFNDIEVIDCLNDIVDKICSDFDKCTEYLFKDTFKPSKKITQEAVTNAMNDTNWRTPKSTSLLDRPKRNIKLKYKSVKKAKTRVTKKSKNADMEKIAKMSTIVEQTEEETIVEDINPESDTENMPKCNEIKLNPETPIQRRKRKLYSPRDDNIDKVRETMVETSDDLPLFEVKSRKNITNTTATCYKELERERKKYSRIPRPRKSKVIEMPSPRTIQMNSTFDNLKQTVESNEKITLVDKSKDVYNFTSESDDDDFKKKVVIKKTPDTKVKKGRKTRRTKETDSSYEEVNTKPKRKKVNKRNKKLDIKTPVIDLVADNLDLVDEKMREAAREELNTSIVIEKQIDLEPTEIEPILIDQPQMEEIYESVSNDTKVSKTVKNSSLVQHVCESNDTILSKATKEFTCDGAVTLAPTRRTNRVKKTGVDQKPEEKPKNTASKKKPTKRVNKNTEMLKIKKEKGLAKKDKVVTDKDDDRTISPLPGLVVESMPKQKEDVNDSLTTNMLQRVRRIYKDGPDNINDSAYTQKMLSDVERFNQSVNICNIDDIYFKKNKENVDTKAEKQTIKLQKAKFENEITENEDLINIDQTEKSIASDSINAHGDLDETPPRANKEDMQPRELQDLDQSMRDYFTKLTKEIHNTTKNFKEDGVDKNKSAISPIVSVKRISFEDIRRWMPSRRTSYTDGSQTTKASQINIQTPRLQKELNISDEATPKSIKTTITKEKPDASKSPIVALSRLSLEDFDKWLPMPTFKANENIKTMEKPNDLKLVYRTRSKTKARTLAIEQIDLHDKEKTKPTAKVNTDSDSDNDNDRHFKKPNRNEENKKIPSISPLNIPENDNTFTAKRKVTKIDLENTDHVESIKTSKGKESPAKAIVNSKPIVSPIKVNSALLENSSDDECVRKIRSMFSKEKKRKVKRAESIKRRSTPPMRERKKRRVESNDSIVFEVKRNESKKIKVLEDIIISESGPSISSVNDWFKRRVPASQRDNASLSYKDTIQNVMEKLDTTLVEMNQNTSKKFVNLFMEVHKQLIEQKKEHHMMFKKLASDLITEMVKVMDDKFAEFDKNSQEMSTNFMEKFKNQAFDLISDDCKQKRDLVSLLKEDVQTAMSRIERDINTDSQ